MNAIVIGAGVDELIAAQLLARAGHKVLVLDGRDGQEPETEGWIAPQLVRELGLDRLRIRQLDPWIAAPLPGGDRLELWQDMARSVESIRRLSARDAERWPEFCGRMARAARLLEALYAAPPPDPMGGSLGDLAQLLGLALRAHRAGRQVIEDLLRLLPMPVADLLDDWFESDALKGLLGSAGILHLRRGPRAGGTALALLHQHVGSAPGVFRPPFSNVATVLRAMPGVEIRRAEVARIHVRDGRVAGVAAGDGELAAALVVSGAGPKRTLLELLEPGWLDPELARAVRQIRSAGAVARTTLELDRAPGFERLAIAPSPDYLERASDDAKYGRVSARPYLEARYCGEAGGRQRVELHLQYAPRALAEGEWDDAVRLLLEQLPELGGAIVGRKTQEPPDLHAELALDQFLWMRPVPALARYGTPVEGLYLCGPAMHPGAGVPGVAGLHCAREVLHDFGRRMPA